MQNSRRSCIYLEKKKKKDLEVRIPSLLQHLSKKYLDTNIMYLKVLSVCVRDALLYYLGYGVCQRCDFMIPEVESVTSFRFGPETLISFKM